MKLVYKADNIAEAQIVKGMLESSGIEAHAGGYYLQGGVGEMATMDFANVQVDEDDYAKAREIVEEYEAKRTQPSSPPESADAGKAASGARLLLAVFAVMMLTALFLYLATR